MEHRGSAGPAAFAPPGAQRITTDRLAADILHTVHGAGSAFVVVESDSAVVFATSAACELVERDLVGTRLDEAVDAVDRTRFIDMLSVEASRRESFRLAGQSRSLDFAVRPHAPVGSGSEPPAEALRIVDVSARLESDDLGQEAYAAIQRSLALLESMPDLLFRISSDMTFRDFRDPTMKGLDLTPENFLGHRLDEFLPRELVDLIEPNLQEALRTGETINYVSHYDYEDGRHTFDNRVVKSGDDEVVLICRDTTEQTRTQRELQRNRALFERIVEQSREYTSITDETNTLQFVSAPVERILGFAPSELIGQSWLDLVHPDDLPSVAHLAGERPGPLGKVPVRLRLRVKNGGWKMIEASSRGFFSDDLTSGLLTHCRDVSDYVAVQEELRQSLARLDAIVDTAAEGIVTLAATGDVLSVNAAARRMFGLADDVDKLKISDLIAEFSYSLIVGDQQSNSARPDYAILDLPSELTCVRADAGTFPATVSVSGIMTDIGMIYSAIVRDDSERLALERQLEFQATHDSLTGIPNRTLFMSNLERALRTAEREGGNAAVIFLDLDRFKIVNDSLGHAAGDRLLCGVANRLVSAVRGDATVARFGGDEFIILCPDLADTAAAETIAQRILDVLSEPIDIGEDTPQEVFVNASAGVALYSPNLGTVEPELLVRNADVALYRAKDNGRNRLDVFHWDDRSKDQSRLSIETALRKSIPRNELLLHYQPVWSASKHRFTATEALLRWKHRGEYMMPGRFISIAEESDLIVDIGKWVLQEACEQTATWQAMPGLEKLVVAVNVSGRQLDQASFPDTVRRALADAGLEPRSLTLEITESRLIHDDRRTLDQLQELKEIGVGLAIDDFGTGYSSLGYLRNLPVDVIKLDQCFTSQFENDRQTLEIVRTITSLAHALNMVVVAEGVETEGQLSALLDLACDYAQGYLLARPAPSEDISELLMHQASSLRGKSPT